MAVLLVACAASPRPDAAPTSDRAAATASPATARGDDFAARPPDRTPVRADPAVLRGLNETQVVQLIGAPAFRRADGPAALWRYSYRGCVLDLYFRAEGALKRVMHFEFRRDPKTAAPGGGAAPGIDTGACFGGLTGTRAKERG